MKYIFNIISTMVPSYKDKLSYMKLKTNFSYKEKMTEKSNTYRFRDDRSDCCSDK